MIEQQQCGNCILLVGGGVSRSWDGLLAAEA